MTVRRWKAESNRYYTIKNWFKNSDKTNKNTLKAHKIKNSHIRHITLHYITSLSPIKLFQILLLRRKMLGRQWYGVVSMVQQVLKWMTSANVVDQEVQLQWQAPRRRPSRQVQFHGHTGTHYTSMVSSHDIGHVHNQSRPSTYEIQL